MTSVSTKSNEHTGAHPGDLALLKDVAEDVPTILVVNKIDRWKDKSALLPLLAAYTNARKFAAVVPISARTEDGVELVLDEVAKLLPERGPVYEEDFLTDKPIRFFAAEYIREQVILETDQEVPHSVAVSVERFDEAGGKVVHIDAVIRCARAGQRAILVGKGGERIKQIGIAARARIEALLERQVNLKLWVEVSEAWVDSPTALSELGYDSTVNLEEPRS
jgi:GTP-binding protein Era